MCDPQIQMVKISYQEQKWMIWIDCWINTYLIEEMIYRVLDIGRTRIRLEQSCLETRIICKETRCKIYQSHFLWHETSQ